MGCQGSAGCSTIGWSVLVAAPGVQTCLQHFRTPHFARAMGCSGGGLRHANATSLHHSRDAFMNTYIIVCRARCHPGRGSHFQDANL